MWVSSSDEIFTTWTNDIEGTNISVFCLCGELDASSVPVFLADVQSLIERSRDIVMDVHLLEYVDSTGVSAMLSTKNALSADGKRVCLAGCHGLLSRILQITGIGSEIECFDDIEQAIESIKA